MRATVLNCSLKSSDQPSNTQQLTEVVIKALREHDVEIEVFRIADMSVLPGVETDLGDGDEWPQIHQALLKSEILVIATPTWVGHPSSLAQRVLERMDAMISETDAEERPVAYNRTAGVVVTGNEDGAHHVISEINGALVDIGYTIAPQGWTYWNRGPGPGPSYLETEDGHDWSHSTGRAMAQNLVGVARALKAQPLNAPLS